MQKPDTGKFIILADVPPQIEKSALALYAQSGIGVYVLTEDYVNYEKDPEEFERALCLLDESGLDVFVRGLGYDIFPRYFDKFKNFDFHTHPSVKGFYLIDEPGAERFEGIAAEYVKFFNEKYSDMFWHINLLPSYATDEQLGIGAGNGRSAFENYVQEYAAQVLRKVNGKKDIGFDHYPLYVKSGKYSVSGTWLTDLAVMAEAAKANGARLSACIQAFTGRADGWSPPEGWRMPSQNGILWQFYVSMAFGASVFEIFLYRDAPDFELANGMVSVEGYPGPTYFYVRDAIAEIKLIEQEIMSFTWNGVIAVPGKKGGGEAVRRFAGRTPVAGEQIFEADYDAIVGVFERGGDKALLIVNYTDPIEKKINGVTLSDGSRLYLKPGGAEWVVLPGKKERSSYDKE